MTPIIYEPFLQPFDEHPNAVAYMETLRRQCRGALGFTPLSGYVEAIKRRRVLIASMFDEPYIGFIHWTKVGNRIKIMQLAVEEDYRRRGVGTILLNAVNRYHHTGRPDLIQLRCRADLKEANKFWIANRFNIYNVDTESNKQRLPINEYERRSRPLQ